MPKKRLANVGDSIVVESFAEVIVTHCCDTVPKTSTLGIRPVVQLMHVSKQFARVASQVIDDAIRKLTESFLAYEEAYKSIPNPARPEYKTAKTACSILDRAFMNQLKLVFGLRAVFTEVYNLAVKQVTSLKTVDISNWRQMIVSTVIGQCMLCDSAACGHERIRMGIYMFGDRMVCGKHKCFETRCICVVDAHRLLVSARPNESRYSANLLAKGLLAAAGHHPGPGGIINAADFPNLERVRSTNLMLLPCKAVDDEACLSKILNLSPAGIEYALTMHKATLSMETDEAEAARAFRQSKYSKEMKQSISFYSGPNVSYEDISKIYDKFDMFINKFISTMLPHTDLNSKHMRTRLTFVTSFDVVQRVLAETILLVHQLPKVALKVCNSQVTGDAISYLFQHDLAYVDTGDSDGISFKSEYGRGKLNIVNPTQVRHLFQTQKIDACNASEYVALGHIFDVIGEMDINIYQGCLCELKIESKRCPTALIRTLVAHDTLQFYHKATLEALRHYPYLSTLPIPKTMPVKTALPNAFMVEFLEQFLGATLPFPELRGLALRSIGVTPLVLETSANRILRFWKEVDIQTAPTSTLELARVLKGLRYETMIPAVDAADAMSLSSVATSSEDEGDVEYPFP
jgi:hypothetical protein